MPFVLFLVLPVPLTAPAPLRSGNQRQIRGSSRSNAGSSAGVAGQRVAWLCADYWTGSGGAVAGGRKFPR